MGARIWLFVDCTGNPNLVMALAGNKADLSSKRKIEAEVRCTHFLPLSYVHRRFLVYGTV